MIVLKMFHNNGIKTVQKSFAMMVLKSYLKGFLMMVLKRFHSGDTKNVRYWWYQNSLTKIP